ncbi:MAG: 2-C-methyl-D-erythritol 4-phosphate cytidylyltransferase [Lachnospiraceae bacterium]|nr:2-C-methyl-D-erythritol 4-phosphate cytidylyltransferase [Lachnospiraceae bacterium]
MNIALILAGGTGTRLGSDIPKQYMSVKGKMIITHCLHVFGIHPQIDAVQIVAHEQWHEEICEQMPGDVTNKFRGFSEPGTNRQRSLYHGLQDIMRYAEESDVVIVHDAARPLVSADMLSACVEACKEHDGVVPVLPMKDTVYLGDGRMITSLLERERVYAGQAPEAFLLGKYFEANRCLMPDQLDRINGSTEPAVMAGLDIAMIPGDEGNFKITTQADLERYKQLLETPKLQIE